MNLIKFILIFFILSTSIYGINKKINSDDSYGAISFFTNLGGGFDDSLGWEFSDNSGNLMGLEFNFQHFIVDKFAMKYSIGGDVFGQNSEIVYRDLFFRVGVLYKILGEYFGLSTGILAEGRYISDSIKDSYKIVPGILGEITFHIFILRSLSADIQTVIGVNSFNNGMLTYSIGAGFTFHYDSVVQKKIQKVTIY